MRGGPHETVLDIAEPRIATVSFLLTPFSKKVKGLAPGSSEASISETRRKRGSSPKFSGFSEWKPQPEPRA